MEYLGGGSALDLMKAGPCEEVYAAIILRETLNGLDYLHSEGKLHRDIKAVSDWPGRATPIVQCPPFRRTRSTRPQHFAERMNTLLLASSTV